MTRNDGRDPGDLRPITFQRGFTKHAPGSVLASFGDTRVLCTATYQDSVPPFLQGKGRGWLTAEYSMLPSSTGTRKSRDRNGKVDGRSVEIQRLIGRSLRAGIDLEKLGERTVTIDCDVLRADGGTRTASITGGWVALTDAVLSITDQDGSKLFSADNSPLGSGVAAVSVGLVEGQTVLDLDYPEDSSADVDMNVVMTGDGRFIEVQGGGEGATFDRASLDGLVSLASKGLERISGIQAEALAE